jgi:hypothetical protein
METSQIITALASLAILALPLLFQETIKEFIKKSFSDISPKQVRKYFAIFLIICFVSSLIADNNEPSQETFDQIDEYKNDTIQAVVEGAKIIIEEGEEFFNEKRTRDSIALANREKRWVYKIGDAIDNESDAWDAAMELSFLGDISIFKEERKSYVIICDPIFDQEELEASLSSYELQLDSIGLNYRIKVIDLMTYCSKKESIVETEAIDKRKHDEVFRCFTCDK